MSRSRSIRPRSPRSRQAMPVATPAMSGTAAIAPRASQSWSVVVTARRPEVTTPATTGPHTRAPMGGFFQRTCQTHAAAPAAAHWDSVTTARGSPQLVGNRSTMVRRWLQSHRGASYPATGVTRMIARARPISTTSTTCARLIAVSIAPRREKIARGLPRPMV